VVSDELCDRADQNLKDESIPYSDAFVKFYTAAQSDRMNDWIEQALHIRAETAGGTWPSGGWDCAG